VQGMDKHTGAVIAVHARETARPDTLNVSLPSVATLAAARTSANWIRTGPCRQ